MDPRTYVWNLILVNPLLSLLVGAYDLIPDFGFAIVIVTILIRLVLYPLYVTQIRSQRAMQEIGPAMKELQQKYGKDKQRIAEEQMKLYRERGVNPAMGCLPLLLQMPILFAMYAAFLNAPHFSGEELKNTIWAFVPTPIGAGDHLDLTAHWLPWISSCMENGTPLTGLACKNADIGIPAGLILPAFAGVFQLIASLMAMPTNQPKSDDPQVRMTQSMSYYFPLITVFFAYQYQSGLAVYWVVSTFVQIVQQYFVSGWGQLPRWLPFLRGIPTPADAFIARQQRVAVAEVEADMSAAPPRTRDEEDERRTRRRRRRGR
ncbi:MAG: membrane protein insertase YidC [Chloroflexota bacterium]|nr:membrane protein insertase YidC [Chloroflexota bacterium]MDE3194358.1 membrane protein insertase YidC [Chloroflexota bacterium]